MAEGWQGVTPNHGQRIGGLDWSVQCPKPNCYFSLGARSQGEGEKLLREHRCPQGGTLKIGWYNVGVSLVRQLWDKLDAGLVEYKTANPTDTDISKAIQQGYLRGLSEAIQLFMQPYYPNTDAVAKEAGKRYKAHQEGNMEWHSPGLDMVTYQPPPGAVEAAVAASTTAKKATAPPKKAGRPAAPKRTLSDDDKADIAFGLESGMFTKDALAKQYGITVAEVEALG